MSMIEIMNVDVQFFGFPLELGSIRVHWERTEVGQIEDLRFSSILFFTYFLRVSFLGRALNKVAKLAGEI